MSTACCLSAMTESGAASITRRTQRISPAAPTAWRDTRRLWDMTAGWSFFATGRKRIWPFPSGSGYRTEPDLKPTDKAALLFFLPFFTFRDAPQTVSGQLPSRRAQDPSCDSALHRGNVLQHSGVTALVLLLPLPEPVLQAAKAFPSPLRSSTFSEQSSAFWFSGSPSSSRSPHSTAQSSVNTFQYNSMLFKILGISSPIPMNADYLPERWSIL